MVAAKEHPRVIGGNGQIIRTKQNVLGTYNAYASTEFGPLSSFGSPTREAAVKKVIRKIQRNRKHGQYSKWLESEQQAKNSKES